jgi:hypothetical protein
MAIPEPRLRFDTDWKYAPAPESTEHARIERQYELFIGGQFVAPRARKYFDSINPATEKVLARVARADRQDVDRAVSAARQAFERSWSKLAPAARGKYLYRIARMLQERAREFAVIESLDGGKPIRESRDVDVPLAAAHFFYYAGWADKLEYAFPGRRASPLGVAGQIIPWNFPLLMAAWKIAPALACGNTVVLKPAETTPLTALKLAELMRDVDLPPGVVNVVTGAGDTGAALVDHPGVDKIAFTGSTEIGRLIMRRLAGTGKHYTLELGGIGEDLQPGPRLLRRLAPAGAGIGCRRGHRQAKGKNGDADRRRPARQEHRHRRDQLRRAAREDRAIPRHRQGGGRRDVPELLSAPRRRLLVPADAIQRGGAVQPRGAGGDLRAGARDPDLPQLRGGAR